MTARKTGTLCRCLLLPFTIILAAMVISGCGGGGSSDSSSPPVVPNTLPIVDAGLPQAVTIPAAATLNGTVTDDGLPNPPGLVTTTWSVVSGGQGTVTFANPSAVATTASFTAAGTYKLRLTANDGGGAASDEVTVTVTGGVVPVPNQPPAVIAGPDQDLTLPAAATLNGTVTDDGLPDPPGAVTTTWSQVSGPGTVTFANPGAVDTTASFSAAGTYKLRLTANDGGAAASDEVTVTVTGGVVPVPNQPPAVNAGPDLAVTLPTAASLDGTVIDDGLPSPPSLTTTWSQVSGPGTVTFGNTSAVNTTASFSAAGTYVLSLTANDGGVVASDTVTVTVIAAPTPTPNISLLTEQTDFGAVVLDQSADKNIQITNTGNGNLTIGQITLPANPFSKESDSCSGAVISPSSSCNLTIRFAPTSQNDFSGSFDIPSNDPDGTVTATLAGEGRALNVSITGVALVGQTVQVIVSVRDQFDAPVTTLAGGNFSIVENGSPQNILNVSNTISSPLSVGMVLDYSLSLIHI